MSFGTFDHFHAGHEFYLTEAKALGDFLIVVIARDETVRRIKGNLPDQSERLRMKTVKQSGIADRVILGELGDKYKVIRKWKPQVIALGYDQFVFTPRLGKYLIEEGMNAKIVRLPSYRPEVYKTSLLRHSYEPKLLPSEGI